MKLKTLVLSTIAICSATHLFAQNSGDKKDAIDYGKTVVAIAPLSLTEESKGIGLSYERALDKEGIIALWVPVSLGFRTYDTYNSNPSTVYGNFYAMPGLKIYPTGSFDKCKYSIGPNLVVATGSKNSDTYYNPTTGGGETINFFRMGFMVNNSLNINPLPHLYLGLDFGLGITYVNQEKDAQGNSSNKGTNGLVYFAFRIGYRN